MLSQNLDEVDFNFKLDDPTYAAKLCQYVEACPKQNGCSRCPGRHPIEPLRLIEPELTTENIARVVNIYEILLE